MSRRISDVERVTAYFQTTDEDAATLMLQVIKGILSVRWPKAKVKKRGAKKPQLVPNADATALAS